MGAKGRKKEKISSKEVVFTKADESTFMLAPEITSDSEFGYDCHEPLPPLPKLMEAAPSGTSERVISLSDLTLNMADLTLDTPSPKKTRPSIKVSPAYVIKKKTEKSPADSNTYSDKKADSSTGKLLLTFMKEESGPKVVFEDDSLGDTEGYGSVNCNGITFTKEPFKTKMMKLSSFLLEEEMSMSLICHLSIKKAMHVSLPRPLLVSIGFGIRDCNIKNLNEVKVKELSSDNGTEFRNHKLEEFCDENEGDAINFNENISFPDDEFLKPRSKVTQCPSNTKYFTYIPAYENTTPSESPILQESVISEDPPEFTEADNHPALKEPDQTKSTDLLEPAEPQINIIFVSISDDQPSPTISPLAKVILQTLVPQDRWSREKHIELVNIIGEPFAGITTRSRIKDSNATSASEYLYVNFLSKMEPKKLIEALEEEGWIIAMQEELNQFERNKHEGIDYKETFVPVARLEAIRIFLAYAAYMGFMVYQMNVKSTFLNGKISEEVYVQQPHGFESSEYPNHVCPDESGVSINETLFRGMIGSLMYLKASKPDIQFFTCLYARYQANPKESHLVAVKRIFRKSTSGGCQILGGKLECWSAKKQSSVAMSSAEAEYVAAAGCYAQVLWIKSQLADYDVLNNNDKPLSFTQDEFVSAIGLPICKDAAPLPPNETVRVGLVTLDYVSNDLTLVKPHTITVASFQKPLASEVLLTSHMLKVAKLSKEPEQSLIPPSGEVNADDTADKSLSRASMQLVIQSKAKTDLKTKKKKIPPSSKPKPPHKFGIIPPKKQVVETQHAEVIVATADATKSLEASELAGE
uniref:Reverse transcriptase Ty1/copia-type domain-containing protein n=1 Tax=Tanacetum cinerariifolium TaxID=118510 RepID=A0A6L2P5H1_TANCI|nr:hypothetical protein [Tanacetum cinerariifolium]